MKMKTNSNSNKRLVPLALTLMVALVTLTLCLISSAGAPLPSLFKTNANTQNPFLTDHIAPLDDRAITWDVRMNFSETGGKTDYVYFGEAPDARDGPPADIYDVAKPPAPMPSYIRAYLKDGLPSPYVNLWKDYRQYPENAKVWNLSVLWYPEDEETNTTNTMSWSTAKINASEYDKVVLTNASGVLVPNMRTTSSFTYYAIHNYIHTFKIECTVDTKPPQIINHSPSSGETGDSFTFNASVFDDMTPKSALTVQVNWAHGSLSGNDTMTNASGNYFVKTITLSNYSTSALTYHFYAKDTAKIPNVNYTAQLSAPVSDDELPTITGDSGNVVVGTGNTITLWVSATDNIGVTSAKATIDLVDHAMAFNSGNSHWEYAYTAPSGSTAGHAYTVTVYDLAANSRTNASRTITVNDDDTPVITGDSGNVVVGTGNTITLWVSAT
ncbi:MAG: hypothetical protein IMZ58_02180, partial [Thermoplasmata archaeon]|nr:hypothetical protein [Thermoplasmata archaeon]